MSESIQDSNDKVPDDSHDEQAVRVRTDQMVQLEDGRIVEATRA